jgi:hypothetical protein
VGYSTPPPPHDPAKADERKALVETALPIQIGDPAFLHLAKVRGIDPAVVLSNHNLLCLPSPIPGRPKTDAALVALLQPDPDDAPTGAELTFVDHGGAKSAAGPARVTWSFVKRGCSTAWFWAGGTGDVLVLCEGFGAKALALVSAGVPGVIIGGGSRVWLGNDRPLPSGVKRAIVVADRRPAEGERDEDGRPSTERHDRDYRRAADRLLLDIGEDKVRVTPDPPCGCCKDSDAVLRTHGAEAVRAWVESATPAALSSDGWIEKIARMSSSDFELNRAGLAKDYAQAFGKDKVRVSFIDDLRKQGLADACSTADAETSARARLVAIAIKQDLFRDEAAGEAFTTVTAENGATRTYKVSSKGFSDWLLDEYGRQYPETIDGVEVPGSVTASTRHDAVRAIEALARRRDTRPVFLRVGWRDGAVFLDMATQEPAVIEITPDGWSITPDPLVAMVHSPAAKPLPEPEQSTIEAVRRELSELWSFAEDSDEFTLLLGFLVGELMPVGPYAVALLTGEQGSAKTSRARMLKLAVDPTRSPVRTRPKSVEDLAICAWRSRVAVYDNLSKLPQDMSDAICGFTEGAGLGKRELFTDTEEILVEAQVPVVLTSIPDVATSGDLVDRSVLVRCEPLPRKMNERALKARFAAFYPKLLWFLIDATACALRRLGDMPEEHEGLRRGDWCTWVEAAAPALGLEDGAFTAAYQRNQDQAVKSALELDPVAAAVLKVMDGRAVFEGMASVLHAELEVACKAQHSGRLPLGWPSLTHHLVGRLRRVAPLLRRAGIEFEQDHVRTGSKIRLTSRGSAPEARTPAANGARPNGADQDVGNDAPFEAPQPPPRKSRIKRRRAAR